MEKWLEGLKEKLYSGPPGPPGSIEFIRWRASKDAEGEEEEKKEDGIMRTAITKGAILAAGVSLVSAGAVLIQEGNLEGGCALILAGFGLIVVFIYLLDKEVTKHVLIKMMEAMGDG